MWDAFLTVCTAVGMLTVYTVVIGTVVVWGLRIVKQRQARRAGRVAHGAPQGIDRRAKSWDEMPEWISQDREWAAAVVVLGSVAISERTAEHIDFTARRVDWVTLRSAAAGWDQHARTLVDVADALAHASPYRHQAATVASPDASSPV